MQQKLDHLAIIMDGSARWAKVNGKTKAEGHTRGAKVAKSLLPHLSRLNINYLTIYALSSENWQRPKTEIKLLINLLSNYVLNEKDLLNKYNIKLKIVGDLQKLSNNLQCKIQQTISETENNSGATLCIAFSYGSRAEIVRAAQYAIDNKIERVTEENFQKLMYDRDMPNVDLLIRTSGVYRVSNFLLWQLAYAELYFLDKFWPDFTITDLEQAIEHYLNQVRTFGHRLENK
ncbi:MAG: polyprenyl diphosphate synthase [Rickettsiaceae bacterium]